MVLGLIRKLSSEFKNKTREQIMAVEYTWQWFSYLQLPDKMDKKANKREYL